MIGTVSAYNVGDLKGISRSRYRLARIAIQGQWFDAAYYQYCNNCGTKYRKKKRLLGRSIHCKTCGQVHHGVRDVINFDRVSLDIFARKVRELKAERRKVDTGLIKKMCRKFHLTGIYKC